MGLVAGDGGPGAAILAGVDADRPGAPWPPRIGRRTGLRGVRRADQRLASERIFEATGIRLKLIPFKGSAESSAAALGGHVDVYVGSIAPVLAQLKEGNMKGLLVTSAEPQAVLPGLPGLKAIGHPELATEAWRGFFVPKGTPKNVIQKLESVVREMQRDTAFAERIAKVGEDVNILGPAEFERRIRAEFEDFGRIIRGLTK